MTDVLIFGVLKQTQRKQVSPLPTLYYNRELKGHIFLPFSLTCSFRTKKWQLTFYSKQMKAGSHRRLRIMSWNLLPSFPSFYLLETQADYIYSSQTHELQWWNAPNSPEWGLRRSGCLNYFRNLSVVLFFLLVDTSPHILLSVNPCCPFQVSSQSVTF